MYWVIEIFFLDIPIKCIKLTESIKIFSNLPCEIYKANSTFNILIFFLDHPVKYTKQTKNIKVFDRSP